MTIDPRQFLDTAEELHALGVGLCEILCPVPPYFKAMSEARTRELSNEWHYYALGRGLGIFAWLGIAALVKEIFF